jgi:flagellum-specific peptidoglycan hydrolase FlgJ
MGKKGGSTLSGKFIFEVIKAAAKIQKDYGLPAAAITAQACLETGFGKYVSKDMFTGKYSYNLFNIKGSGPAGSVTVKTWEVYNGVKKTILAKFRAYNNYEESFDDYVSLITRSQRYAPCLAVKDDPDEYARQLQNCGYATDPKYALKLISIMDSHKLRELAEEVVGTEDGQT